MPRLSDGPEYLCAQCGIRLDPLMTPDEAQWFFDNGCPECDANHWLIDLPGDDTDIHP